MRPEDRTRILHMIEAAETVAGFISSRVREDLDADRMLLFALVRAVEVFGEAAAKVSADAGDSANHPMVPDHRNAKSADTCVLRYRRDHSLENRDRRNPGLIAGASEADRKLKRLATSPLKRGRIAPFQLVAKQ